MVKKNKVSKKKEDHAGMLFLVGMFLGIGIGLLTGHIAAFTLIGIAVGFLMKYYAKR